MKHLDSSAPDFLASLDALTHHAGALDEGVDRAVADILADVRARGDAAVLAYTRKFDRLTDAHALTLQPAIAPGPYVLRVGLWDRLSGARLRVLDAAGQPGDQDGFTLAATLTVQP